MPNIIYHMSLHIAASSVVFSLLVIWIGVGGSICPESWTFYPLKKMCVKSIATFMDFDTAVSRCKDEIKNGELVRIENEADNEFLTNMITLYQGYWIGLDDRETSGVWKDVNCKEATWFNWDQLTGDPDGMGSEHCIATRIYLDSGKAVSRFRDQLCSGTNYVICMVDLNDSRSALFHMKNDTRSTTPATQTTTVNVPLECAVHCLQVSSCRSYSLQQRMDGKFTCELVDGPSSSAPGSGWMYFSKCK